MEILWGDIFQKVVQNDGSDRRGENTTWCRKAGGAVPDSTSSVHRVILTLKLDEVQEGEAALFLILDDLELYNGINFQALQNHLNQ